MSAELSVAVIGTGRMGTAIARGLLLSGHPVTVYNRTQKRAGPCVAAGARLASSVREAVSSADVTIVCVLDYAASDMLIERSDVVEALRGADLIQFTSGSSTQARDAAHWAADHEIRYLEGFPIFYPDQLGLEEAVAVYAGVEAVFAERQLLLSALGRAVFLGADPTLANAVVLCTTPMYHGAMLGVLQGAALGRTQGLSNAQFEEVMVAMLPAIRLMVEDLTTRISSGETSEPHSSIANQLEVSAAVLEVCRAEGIATDIPSLFAACFNRTASLADLDVAAMAESFNKAR